MSKIMTQESSNPLDNIEDYWKVSNDLDDLKNKIILFMDRTGMRKEAMNLIKDRNFFTNCIEDIQQNFDLICTNAERRLINENPLWKEIKS